MTIPRLRRDDPLEVIDHLVTKVGTRRATSLGEADAAAFVDSRLRLAGLQVNADSFSAATSLGLTYPLLALLGITAAALSLWMVLPAFFTRHLWANLKCQRCPVGPAPRRRRPPR